MALTLKITNAGLSLIAQTGSIGPVVLSELALGSGTWPTAPTASTTALKTLIKRLPISGDAPNNGYIHLFSKDSSTDSYSAYEVGLYTSTNVLFAIGGSTTVYITKADVASALIAIDLSVSNVPSGTITVGDTNFLFTQATETIAGIAEIATQAEVTTGTSDLVVVTPLKLKNAKFIPSGAVMAFASSGVPSGWLKCNGQAVSRTSYSELFEILGTAYGAGNNSTTFNVPDLRGEFIRGWDDGRGVDGGRVINTAQGDLIKSHTHNLDYYQHTRIEVFGGSETNIQGVEGGSGFKTTSSGTNTGVETRPRNIALLYCIKV